MKVPVSNELPLMTEDLSKKRAKLVPSLQTVEFNLSENKSKSVFFFVLTEKSV